MKDPFKGKLIAVCGGDACGKATQTKLLAERLGGTRFSFPNYESETGKIILGHLKTEWHANRPEQIFDTKLNNTIFQSLQTVNRIELLPTIREAMLRGPVVMDRYWMSAVVYGSLDGLDPDWLERVQNLLMPPADVQILIDVPVDTAWKRRPERRDRYESNRSFLEKVRAEYLRAFNARSNQGGAFYIVDGTKSVRDVHLSICEVLRKNFGRDFIDEKQPWEPRGGWLEVA